MATHTRKCFIIPLSTTTCWYSLYTEAILADTHSMEPIVHCSQTLPKDPYLSLRINSIKHSLSLLTMCTWELSALKLQVSLTHDWE